MRLATKVDFDHTAFSPPSGGVMAKQQNDGGSPTVKMGFGVDKMTGDSGSGGEAGVVPAPAAGDAAAGKYLKADGTWAVLDGGGFPWGFYVPGAYSANQLIAAYRFTRPVTFPADWSDGTHLPNGGCTGNPTATATWTIKKVSGGVTTTVGTWTWSTSGVPTFATAGGTSQSFAIGDEIQVVNQATPDATFAGGRATVQGAGS